MLFFKRTFQSKVEATNRVFISTIEELKVVQVDVTAQIKKNEMKIQSLSDANSELEALRSKTEKQIEEISKQIV